MASPDERPPTPPQYRMAATRLTTLVIAALVTALLVWLVIDRVYHSLPDLPWLPPLTMFGLGVVEAVAARDTRARVERRAGAGRVDPLLVARYVVLAKASALAGSIFLGLYLGLAGWLLTNLAVQAHVNDLPAASAGIVGTMVLVAGALLLERACRVPPSASGGESAQPGRSGSDGGEGGPGR